MTARFWHPAGKCAVTDRAYSREWAYSLLLPRFATVAETEKFLLATRSTYY